MQEIKNEGWILLWRKLLRSDMWKSLTSMQRDLVIACLLKANHKENRWEWKGDIFICKQGQFITSLESLRTECAKKTTIKMVRSGLKKLEKWGFLAHEGSKTGSKISIINWHTYQVLGKAKGKDEGTIGAHQGQDEGTIGATNNNENNDNNDEQCKEEDISGGKKQPPHECIRLAQLLKAYVLKNNSTHLFKTDPVISWAKEIDLAIRMDKRPYLGLKTLIRFSQYDTFWYQNIKSAKKLRKQYDDLKTRYQECLSKGSIDKNGRPTQQQFKAAQKEQAKKQPRATTDYGKGKFS